MRLCWLVPNDHGGGVISVALSCCRQAEAAGHDVTLLTLVESEGHVEEHVTFQNESLRLSPNDSDAPRALVRWLQENPQEVLFVNDCSPVHPALPHIPSGIRTVFVVHDTARQYWTPAVRHESVLDGIVAVSEVVADQFQGRLDAPDACRVLHNGTLYPSDIPVRAPGERADDLLFLGGDKPFKGAHDVLNLWPRLVEKGFSESLHWYGRVEDPFRRRVRSLPEAARVQVHGRVPRSEIFERAAASTVLLVPSRVEPFGMVTIEGMGMGALPVAWDIDTGTREIVEPGTTGFFATLGDVEALADRVMTACQRHEGLYENAVDVARTQFSEEAMWERYSSFLDELQTWPTADRPEAEQTPPRYTPPTRYFQWLPSGLRDALRSAIGRSPTLSYWLRNLRGL